MSSAHFQKTKVGAFVLELYACFHDCQGVCWNSNHH